MIQSFNKVNGVMGELVLPGDKSISHRAVIFSSMAKGESKIYNLSTGEDVLSTIKCFSEMGIKFYKKKDHHLVKGKGFKGLVKPKKKLDAGNSGTTARLLSGLLIGQDFESVLIGDESLSKRPMKRIVEPLTAMGGKILASGNDTLPLQIFPAEKLTAMNYTLPVASAQVKSAVILAALHVEEKTIIIEKVPSRNHTEKMLGLTVEEKEGKKLIIVSKGNYPEAKEYFIPADLSTAAFFIVLTLLSRDSSLIIKNVSLNETRNGIIRILQEMGGKIEIDKLNSASGELFGDVLVESGLLNNVEIPAELVPNLIDEIPALSVAGIFAAGKFEIRNASELRGKESDRINALCQNYRLLGLDVEEFEDGFSVSGSIKNMRPVFESCGDHRIAMAFSILSLLLEEGGKVNNFSPVKISNPNFLLQLKSIVR